MAQPPGPSPKTIEDILAQLKTIKPNEAIGARARLSANSEPPPKADRVELVNYYLDRARSDRTLGLVDKMLRDARKAAELAQEMRTQLEWEALVELSDAEVWGGNYLNARKARERLAMARSWGWSQAGYAYLAILSADLGDAEGAEDALRATERTMDRLRSTKSWFEWKSDYTARFERARANVLRAKGKYREAEAAQRDAMANTDIAIEVNPRYQYAVQSSLEARREELEGELAYLLIAQDRLQEAEWHARTVLQRTLKRVSGNSPEIVNRLGPLIEILYLEGRFNESRALTSVARDMLARSGAQPVAREFSLLLGAEGRSLVALGEYGQALERYGQLRTNLASDSALQRSYGLGDADWALALLRSGKPAEAAEMLRMLVSRALLSMGAEHLKTGIAQGELGMALTAQGDRDGALAQFKPAMTSLLDPQNLNDAPPATRARIGIIVEAYIALLAELQRTGDKSPGTADPVAEAFRLADAVRGRSVQQALAESAARSIAGTPVLGTLTRRDQDLNRELTALYEVTNRQLSSPPDQQLPNVAASVRARIDAIGIERRSLAATIQKDFPGYAGLIQPKPATIDEARQVLMADEALLSVLVTPTATFVWAIPQSGAASFAASRLTGAEVNALVGSLRKSLDPGPVPIHQLASFDVAAGYRLYSELLAPVESGWRDATSLLVVVNGALAQLPFALLPTQQAKPVSDGQLLPGALESVPWLVKRIAITQLPSVSSLVTLRAGRAFTTERLPFIGFGDPKFSRAPVALVVSTRGVPLRNLAVAHPAQEGTEMQLSAGQIVRSEPKAANWITYDQLAPLPDTREEILAIAEALKADLQKDVFFGAEASARAVKSLDLSQRRVIAFATHGLVAGDLPNLTQPALALAAPANSNESGLLTLDDILGLKLNADWVVLSACNTAAGDGAGAEAISGLGRGFFYAGSRSLLVTHWPVETVSARKLVTGIFQRVAADVSLSRAEALRQSMLALMDAAVVDPATGRTSLAYAHPIFWAPYALVGDPGR